MTSFRAEYNGDPESNSSKMAETMIKAHISTKIIAFDLSDDQFMEVIPGNEEAFNIFNGTDGLVLY